MLKKFYLLTAGILCVTGCTREVYLQAVPCVECEEERQEEVIVPVAPVVPACPCYSEVNTCCPETATMQRTYTYQVQDIAAPVNYTPCAEGKRNCHTVCRQVEVAQ